MARRRLPQELIVSVDRLDGDGCGLGTAEARQVRIRNALAGETAEVRVLRRRKGEWLAEAQQVEVPSPLRREPACEYFPRCGGCVMQHLDYDAQLALKERGLLDALAGAGVEARSVQPPTRGPRYHYRTKARLGVRQVGGRILVGFRESFSNRVGRMDHCLTLTESLGRLLAPLKALIEGLSAPDRIPQVEVAAGDREQALLFRHLDPLTAEDEEAIRRFASHYGVRCYG
ncbi:MAG: 23S rRNA (uracil(1939)-C(5))-methyltransferase, partial [Pseudomonadota bacterium]